MLYITRSRYKESTTAQDVVALNKLIDDELIPALEKVEGVTSAQAYNSISGEIAFILEIQNMATVDRILADQSLNTVLVKAMDKLNRSGGEVLYDRPRWQGMYGQE